MFVIKIDEAKDKVEELLLKGEKYGHTWVMAYLEQWFIELNDQEEKIGEYLEVDKFDKLEKEKEEAMNEVDKLKKMASEVYDAFKLKKKRL